MGDSLPQQAEVGDACCQMDRKRVTLGVATADYS